MAAIPSSTEALGTFPTARRCRGSIAGTAPTNGYIFRFPADTLPRASGGNGSHPFLAPSCFFTFPPLSSVSSFLYIPSFSHFCLTCSLFSERACLLLLPACLHAKFSFTMLMTNLSHKKKGHGGELCLSIHQGGTQVRETWLRDAFGLATTVWMELGWDWGMDERGTNPQWPRRSEPAGAVQ